MHNQIDQENRSQNNKDKKKIKNFRRLISKTKVNSPKVYYILHSNLKKI